MPNKSSTSRAVVDKRTDLNPKPLNMKQKKVAVTGAHGTGKTTLVRIVTERLRDTLSIVNTPEVPRLFVEEIGDQSFFQRTNNTFLRQTMIVARQIESEASLCLGGSQVLLCDRTVVDHWAYTELLFPEAAGSVEGRAWKDIVRRWTVTYDAIHRLPIEFSIELDGVREADIDFQRDVDARIVALYGEFGCSIHTISGASELRERTLIKSIHDLSVYAQKT
jgi:predicted ATPase